MKLAITADLHLRGKDLPVKLRMMHAFVKQAQDRGVAAVVVAGDIFDSAMIGDSKATPQEIIGSFKAVVSESQLPWILVAGNHDLAGPRDPSTLWALRDHPWISLVPDHPSIGQFDAADGTVTILSLPWQDGRHEVARDMETTKGYLRSLAARASGPKILVGHADVAEAAYFHGLKVGEGRWAFSVQDLAELDVDAIFLGHIHNRQEFPNPYRVPFMYCGSMTKLNHAEADQQDAWVLYDVGSRDYEFVTIPGGPVYYTLSPEQYRSYVAKNLIQVDRGDMVRVNGEIPSDLRGLPNVTAMPLTGSSPKSRITMAESGVTLDGLFRAWLDQEKITLSQDTGVWTKLTQFGESWGLDVSGSLDCVKRSKLVGIGPHVDREVLFDPGWNVILGPNESGKTLLLESVVYALYGTWLTPDRGKSLAHEKDSMVEIEVVCDGQTYVISRQPNQSVVTVYSGDEKVAGGPSKAKEAQRWIEDHFGTMRTFTRLCCVDQRSTTTLLEATDTPRMLAMRELLGLDSFDKYCQQCSESKNKLRGAVERLAVSSGQLRELQKILENHITEHNSLVDSYTEGKLRVDACQAALNDLVSEQQEKEQALSAIDAHTRAVSSLLLSIDHGQQRKNDAEAAYRKMSMSQLFDQNRINAITARIQEFQAKSNAYIAWKAKVDALSETSVLDRAGCKDQGFLPCRLIDNEVKRAKELEALKQNPPEHVPSYAVDDLTKQLRTESSLPREEDLERYQLAFHQAESDLESAQIMLEDEKARLKEAQELLGEDYVDKTPEIHELDAEIRNGRDSLRRQHDRIQFLKGAIESTRQRVEAMQAEVDACKASEQEFADWDLLHAAFGRTGIPQLLISEALPSLQAQLDRLTAGAFGGVFRVVIDTQIADSKGNLKEGFSIRYVRGDFEHDVRACSGGRLATIRAIWQVAMILWQAERSRGYKTLFLDEPTKEQDPTNIDAFLRMIKNEASHLGQVLMVTHDRAVAGKCEHWIEL